MFSRLIRLPQQGESSGELRAQRLPIARHRRHLLEALEQRLALTADAGQTDEGLFGASSGSAATIDTTAVWVAQGPSPASNGQVENLDPINPVSGAINVVLAHPVNPNVLYAGAVNGGVWKTSNATLTNPTWVPQTDNAASPSIGAMAFDLSDTTYETLVAGNGLFSSFSGEGGQKAGILRTTNGGDTWVNPGSAGIVGENVSGIAARGDLIVVTAGEASGGGATSGGIFRSTDAGATFTAITSPDFAAGEGFNDLVLDPSDDTGMRLYASGAGRGVFRSDDFGETWTSILDGNAQGVATGPDATNVEITAHESDRLYVAILFNGQPEAIFYADGASAGTPAWTEMQVPVLPLNPGFPVEDVTFEEPEDDEEMPPFPIIITSTGHGLMDGEEILVFDVEGYDEANGYWEVTVIDGDNFMLANSETEGESTWVEGTGQWFRTVGSNPRAKNIATPGSQGRIHFSFLVDSNNPDIIYLGGDRQESGQTFPWPNPIGAEDFTGALFRGNASIEPDMINRFNLQWSHITHDQVVLGGDRALNPPGTRSSTSPHADSRDLAIDALGNLIEVSDGGIYKRTLPTSNQGDWLSLNSNLQVSEIHDVAYDTISNTIISGTQDTGTQYQVNPDLPQWVSLSTADGGDVAVDAISLADVNQSIRYTSMQNLGGFQRTRWDASGNLLASATPALEPLAGTPNLQPQFVTPVVLNNINATRLLIAGGNGLFESRDQAETIASLALGSAFTRGIDYGGIKDGIPNPDVLYAADDSGGVFVRTDARSIVNRTTPGGGTIIDIAMDTENWSTAFAIDSSAVHMTEDSGLMWNDVTGNLLGFVDASGAAVEELHSLEFMKGIVSDAIVVGTDVGVFAMLSTDVGNWFEIGTELPNATVYDMDFDQNDDVLVVGTLGRGAFKLSDAGRPLASPARA